MSFKKGEWAVILFNLAYIVIFAVYYTLIKNYEFLIYIAALLVVALLVLFTLNKSHLDYLALWGLSIWGLLHMSGGGLRINGETLYRLKLIEFVNNGGDFYILKMDQLIHFYGFLVAAIVLFQILALRFKDNKRSLLIIFFAWAGSMGLGALNEVIEFLAFVSLAKTGVGDLYNTGLDLVFNLLGAFAGAIFGFYWNKNKKTINLKRL